MPQVLHFRPAKPEDLPHLERLVNGAYRGEDSKQGWTTEADLLGGQRTDIERLGEMIDENTPGGIQQRIETGYFPTDPRTPVACLYLKQESTDTAYVGLVTVAPALQGGGYGKQLLDQAEKLARDWNCKKLRMTVIDRREELLAYYHRRGYQLTERSEPFPTDDPRFGIPKVQDMKLLELIKLL